MRFFHKILILLNGKDQVGATQSEAGIKLEYAVWVFDDLHDMLWCYDVLVDGVGCRFPIFHN